MECVIFFLKSSSVSRHGSPDCIVKSGILRLENSSCRKPMTLAGSSTSTPGQSQLQISGIFPPHAPVQILYRQTGSERIPEMLRSRFATSPHNRRSHPPGRRTINPTDIPQYPLGRGHRQVSFKPRQTIQRSMAKPKSAYRVVFEAVVPAGRGKERHELRASGNSQSRTPRRTATRPPV